MKTYAVILVTVEDKSWVDDYVGNVTEMVERQDGKFLARTDNFERVEGKGTDPDSIVIIEFPTKEASTRFYNDPEYQSYLQSRLSGSKADFFWVSGEDEYAPSA